MDMIQHNEAQQRSDRWQRFLGLSLCTPTLTCFTLMTMITMMMMMIMMMMLMMMYIKD